MQKIFRLISLVIMLALILTACGGAAKADNLLDETKNRGYILVSTDPNYEPQSFLIPGGKRLDSTKCPSDALTTAEMQGFDVDVANEIGKRLGVETCFATPEWDMITAGNWANKWDISVGSMTIKPARQEVLYFTTPYYYTPAMIAVKSDATFASVDDLANQAICAGTATTYEDWLNGVLDLPASSIYAKAPAGVTVVPLPTDQECAQAIAVGRTDFVAYVTSETVINANIAAGLPVKKLGKAVFSEDLAAAIDKAHSLDPKSLLDAVDKIVKDMHADGTLSSLSTQWFKEDLTQDPTK